MTGVAEPNFSPFATPPCARNAPAVREGAARMSDPSLHLVPSRNGPGCPRATSPTGSRRRSIRSPRFFLPKGVTAYRVRDVAARVCRYGGAGTLHVAGVRGCAAAALAAAIVTAEGETRRSSSPADLGRGAPSRRRRCVLREERDGRSDGRGHGAGRRARPRRRASGRLRTRT